MAPKYTEADLQMLSSIRGLTYLMRSETIKAPKTLRKLRYSEALRKLQVKLIKLQNRIVDSDERVLILFEGGEFAGKGSAIRAFMDHLNPRSIRLVALPKPTLTEQKQWYFRRYIQLFPMPGEMVFFDRSWYNRAIVEPVNGFCTKKEYKNFMDVVNLFEQIMVNDGIKMIKIYLSVSKSEQFKRIEKVKKNPLRRWELTKVDLEAQKLWSSYEKYSREMLNKTNTEIAPWKIIDGNDKYTARLEAIRYVLKRLDAENI